MVTDKKADTPNSLKRILRERLEQFDVPAEVLTALQKEIEAFVSRPEKKPYGAVVMTPSASVAADRAKERGHAESTDEKPKIV
jgi:hypothetical protein